MNTRHFQLAALFVVQVDVGFHAAKCGCHFTYNFIDQFVEIENGRYLLRPLLQFDQMFNLIDLHGTHRLAPEQYFVGL